VPLTRRLAALAALVALLACADSVQVMQSPAQGQSLALGRLAVAPFGAVERPGSPALRTDAAPLVAGYVAEAFGARGLDVVAPTDVAQGLGLYEAAPGARDPRQVAQAAHQKFGAQSVALGRVARFRERAGEALGSTSPASASFEVKLYAAPAGNLLWAGVFDETQVALGANVLQASRYPGGGTRWLTVEELARWGAGQLATRVPLAAE
jgi:hypothetical protein